MPSREFKTLKEKLMRASAVVDYRPHPDLEHVDDAFFKVLVDAEEEKEIYETLEFLDVLNKLFLLLLDAVQFVI